MPVYKVRLAGMPRQQPRGTAREYRERGDAGNQAAATILHQPSCP